MRSSMNLVRMAILLYCSLLLLWPPGSPWTHSCRCEVNLQFTAMVLLVIGQACRQAGRHFAWSGAALWQGTLWLGSALLHSQKKLAPCKGLRGELEVRLRQHSGLLSRPES